MPEAEKTMKPSEVRTLVLSGHTLLRQLLDDIDRLASMELDVPGTGAQNLRARAGELASTLSAHLELEEEILQPILKTIDAWGPVRVERMNADHANQRERIFDIRRQSADPNFANANLARRLRQLVVDLREDMEWEEREMLHPDLLRDDIVSLKQFGG
jgi:iron-sulfur cluster repair protein YtfE (RIC family)